MIDKYNLIFPYSSINKNIDRLTNQIWKLIPMRENNEDWNRQLEVVIIELAGLGKIFLYNPFFLQALMKLEGLVDNEVSFEIYRKTIFETITLIQSVKQEPKFE